MQVLRRGRRLAKSPIASIFSVSARDPFTSRVIITTGNGWGSNALRIVRAQTPPCTGLLCGDFASRRFNWPDLVPREPEQLRYSGKPLRIDRLPPEYG